MTTAAAMQPALGKLLYKIPDAMRLLSMSRSVIYEQIRAGRLRTVKQGRATLIPASAISEYILLLEQEAEAPNRDAPPARRQALAAAANRS